MKMYVNIHMTYSIKTNILKSEVVNSRAIQRRMARLVKSKTKQPREAVGVIADRILERDTGIACYLLKRIM